MIDASDDASDGNEAEAASVAGCPMHQVSQNGSAAKPKLSSEALVKNSVTFLSAGYETTANTISYASYLLALNPDIQERLQSEIDSYFDDKPVSLTLQVLKICDLSTCIHVYITL